MALRCARSASLGSVWGWQLNLNHIKPLPAAGRQVALRRAFWRPAGGAVGRLSCGVCQVTSRGAMLPSQVAVLLSSLARLAGSPPRVQLIRCCRTHVRHTHHLQWTASRTGSSELATCTRVRRRPLRLLGLAGLLLGLALRPAVAAFATTSENRYHSAGVRIIKLQGCVHLREGGRKIVASAVPFGNRLPPVRRRQPAAALKGFWPTAPPFASICACAAHIEGAAGTGDVHWQRPAAAQAGRAHIAFLARPAVSRALSPLQQASPTDPPQVGSLTCAEGTPPGQSKARE